MDEGRYAESEISYRKALSFDSTFLLGQAVVARLTTDLEERLSIFKLLVENKDRIKNEERLVLDVYIALTRFTNILAQEPERARKVLEEVFTLAENNLNQVLQVHPGEIYLKAEYIEVLHARYGAKAIERALDTLLTPQEQDNPFILGYTAKMQAEQGNYDQAMQQANQLAKRFNDREIPKPYAVYAAIYFQMDSLVRAKEFADRAFALDPRNLDASRLKSRIEAVLNSQE